MSLLMTKDKKEIIVTCTCGCHNSFHIIIDTEDGEDYAFMCFMKGNWYTEYERSSPWSALKLKLKKVWYVLRGKDYYYSDTIMSREDFEEFKRYVNQFD